MDRESIPAIPPVAPDNDGENTPNFHAISEERKELRQAVSELGEKNGIFDKHYRKPLEDLQTQAAEFKVADYGGLSGAKIELKKQKADYEEQMEAGRAHIDYEAIFRATPEVAGVEQLAKKITYLKDFRMRRMFEILDPNTSLSTKKRNTAKTL